MKTRNLLILPMIIAVAFLSACTKDPEIPTGKVFNQTSGGEVRFTIRVSSNPSSGGTATGGGTFDQGASCTVTATANTGYTFTNWKEGSYVVSSSASYTFTVNSNHYLVANFSANAPNQYTISVSSNPTGGGTVSGGGTYNHGASCTLTATPAAGYIFVKWTKNGTQVSTNTSYTFTVTASEAYVAYFQQQTVGHAYVDLGLPSGTLWATCNVGATTPEDYGAYFAWGETSPKNTYDWTTYKYANGGYDKLTKYCSNSNYGYNGYTDNLTVLQAGDDAATANWGSGWRMPTKEEWQELYNNTTVTWTIQSGVNGRRFTASNGNSLFLPAAGCRLGSSLNGAGSRGYYWSSSLYTGSPYGAWVFYFNSDDFNMYNDYRYNGLSVRAVRSARQK